MHRVASVFALLALGACNKQQEVKGPKDPPKPSASVEELAATCQERLDAVDYTGAVDACRAAREAAEGNTDWAPRVALSSGKLYAAMGNSEVAATYFEEVTNADPMHEEAWRALAEHRVRLSQYVLGCRAYKQVTRLASSDAGAFAGLAACYARAGEIREARAAYRGCTDAGGGCECDRALGSAALDSVLLDLAVRHLRGLIDTCTEDGAGYDALCKAYARAGRCDDATWACGKANEFSPPEPYEGYGTVPKCP